MFFTDLHCHPILKCYGKNCHHASAEKDNQANLFFHKPFSFWNRIIENTTTITPYRQADFISAVEGNTVILGFSMYSPEKDFFLGDIDNSFLENAVTHFGTTWIDEIKSPKNDYFKTLKCQFRFIEELNGKDIKIGNETYRYRIIQSGKELEEALISQERNTVFLIYNIEGGHNLFRQINTKEETSQTIVPESIEFLKSKAPLYVTMAHHFYNQLTGHCISFSDSVAGHLDQKFGSDLGLRPQGESVIRQLLSTDNGPRILIDIKHMNPRARNQYYTILDEMERESYGKIPIIFSHGGANGMDSFTTHRINNPLLHHEEIGLYDDEIIRLVRSGGLFGLNLDERVMSSPETLKKTKCYKWPKRRFFETSKLIWNNIEQFVRVCATESLNPWPHICIGSDYDGIINPINGFWTLKYMPRFKTYLQKHLHKFLRENKKMDFGMTEQEIIDGIFSRNTTDFIIKHYNPEQEINT